MFEIHPRGPKKDFLGLGDFPGTRSVAEARNGVTAYAWTNHPPFGVRAALSDDSQAVHFHKKHLIKDVKVGFSPDYAWAIYTVIDPERMTEPALVAAQIDGITKFELLGPNGLLPTSPEEVVCISNPNGLYIFVKDLDEGLLLFRIDDGAPELLLQYQG